MTLENGPFFIGDSHSAFMLGALVDLWMSNPSLGTITYPTSREVGKIIDSKLIFSYVSSQEGVHFYPFHSFVHAYDCISLNAKQ